MQASGTRLFCSRPRLGEGSLRRRRAEGDARFLGRRARRGGASRGARSSGAPTTEETRRDASSSPDRRAGAATAGQSWETSARASSRARVAVCVHPARGSCFERYKPLFLLGRLLGCLGRVRLLFSIDEREETGCQPGISFRFHTHGRLERSFDGRRLAARADSVAPRCVSSLTRTLAIGTVAESRRR